MSYNISELKSQQSIFLAREGKTKMQKRKTPHLICFENKFRTISSKASVWPGQEVTHGESLLRGAEKQTVYISMLWETHIHTLFLFPWISSVPLVSLLNSLPGSETDEGNICWVQEDICPLLNLFNFFSPPNRRQSVSSQETWGHRKSSVSVPRALGQLLVLLQYQTLAQRIKVMVRKAESLTKLTRIPGAPGKDTWKLLCTNNEVDCLFPEA